MTSECTRVRELLASNELPATAGERSHLAQCAQCREFQQTIMHLDAGLSSLAVQQPAEATITKLLERVAAESASSASRERRAWRNILSNLGIAFREFWVGVFELRKMHLAAVGAAASLALVIALRGVRYEMDSGTIGGTPKGLKVQAGAAVEEAETKTQNAERQAPRLRAPEAAGAAPAPQRALSQDTRFDGEETGVDRMKSDRVSPAKERREQVPEAASAPTQEKALAAAENNAAENNAAENNASENDAVLRDRFLPLPSIPLLAGITREGARIRVELRGTETKAGGKGPAAKNVRVTVRQVAAADTTLGRAKDGAAKAQSTWQKLIPQLAVEERFAATFDLPANLSSEQFEIEVRYLNPDTGQEEVLVQRSIE